jgi:hypothetical protein
MYVYIYAYKTLYVCPIERAPDVPSPAVLFVNFMYVCMYVCMCVYMYVCVQDPVCLTEQQKLFNCSIVVYVCVRVYHGRHKKAHTQETTYICTYTHTHIPPYPPMQ